MGSSVAEQPGHAMDARLGKLANHLGRAIAERHCVLITGATSGLPHLVALAAKAAGGMTIGISPAVSRREHCDHYHLPLDGLDFVIYTGFGLKGRNVVNIRSSDIIIIFGGSIGTLNEFTIAYDEGKLIGILTGAGGISDHIPEILAFCNKEQTSRIVFNEEPDVLIDMLLQQWKTEH